MKYPTEIKPRKIPRKDFIAIFDEKITKITHVRDAILIK